MIKNKYLQISYLPRKEQKKIEYQILFLPAILIFSILLHEIGHIIFCYLSGGSFKELLFFDKEGMIGISFHLVSQFNAFLTACGGPIFSFLACIFILPLASKNKSFLLYSFLFINFIFGFYSLLVGADSEYIYEYIREIW